MMKRLRNVMTFDVNPRHGRSPMGATRNRDSLLSADPAPRNEAMRGVAWTGDQRAVYGAIRDMLAALPAGTRDEMMEKLSDEDYFLAANSSMHIGPAGAAVMDARRYTSDGSRFLHKLRDETRGTVDAINEANAKFWAGRG